MPIQRITSGIIADGVIVATDIGDSVVTNAQVGESVYEGMILLNNKYKKWYDSLIDNAVKRNWNKKTATVYTENHHILPKCLGGSNDSDNIVTLTAREHFVAHLLLSKMYDDNESKNKMRFAVHRFIANPNKNANRRLTSYMYEYVKKCNAEATKYIHTGLPKPKSEEHRKKIAIARAKQVIPREAYERQAKVISSLVWMNDGKRSYRVRPEKYQECKDKGYVDGRLINYINKEYREFFRKKTTQRWKKVKATGHTGILIRI
jgi:hypothetical protein